MRDIVLLVIAPLFLGVGLGTISAGIHAKHKIVGWVCFILSVLFVFAYVHFAKT